MKTTMAFLTIILVLKMTHGAVKSPRSLHVKAGDATETGTTSHDKPGVVAFGEPVRIVDHAFAEELKRAISAEKIPENGFTVARISGKEVAIVVMVDGTELGRISGVRAQTLLEGFPAIERDLNTAAPARNLETPGQAPSIWSSFESLSHWGAWRQEATANYAVDYLYTGVLVRRNRATGAFFKKIGFAYFGADVEYAFFKGELADSASPANSLGSLAWGLQFGMDFLRYRLGSAPYALPEYFWAERDLEAKYYSRKGATATELVRVFDPSNSPSLEHRVEVKAGPVRYAVIIAPNSYKSPLHYAALEDLPAGFGTWGMGALMAPGTFIPGIWYRTRDFEVTRIHIGGTARALRFIPCRITYFRAERSQFRLAWSGEATVEL